MTRYAAHCIFLSELNEIRKMQAVELDDSGMVVTVFPLTEELRSTRWLGGLIIVSSIPPERKTGESFAEFCKRMAGGKTVLSRQFAYHVSFFDVSAMEFTPASRIRRL